MSKTKPRTTRRTPDAPTRGSPIPFGRSADGRVVPMRLTVQPDDRLRLDAWVNAGGRLGLLDADVDRENASEVHVWVRENPEPAYLIQGGSRSWAVHDRIGGQHLGTFARFEDALSCIRPVGEEAAASPPGTVPGAASGL